MIRIIKADERHFSDYGWLQTYWLFSFSDYYDPSNVQFGSLRVFNDDVVQPGSGFPTHPHREMEIVTAVLSGELTHKDTSGGRGVIAAGEVQRMSAGTGIAHSEFNLSDSPVHLYQIWIYPDEQGLKPGYEQRSFEGISRKNRLLPVASGQGLADTVTIHTDATIYMSEIEAGRSIGFETDPSRGTFIYVTGGSLSVNGERLEARDQARVTAEATIDLKAEEDASLILIDVPLKG
ncbi:MAG TPA: pirin family protein [Blastocatellia bacterium]|nr:pirin family protein [Blastocatellia bacterium]